MVTPNKQKIKIEKAALPTIKSAKGNSFIWVFAFYHELFIDFDDVRSFPSTC